MSHQLPRLFHRPSNPGPASAYRGSPCRYAVCRCEARPERRYCSESCAAIGAGGARDGSAVTPCPCEHGPCAHSHVADKPPSGPPATGRGAGKPR
jgi:hypothetical protein